MTRLHELLPPELVERVGWTLAHSLWQLAAVAVALAIALAVLCRRSPQARYAAGCAALAATFAAPIVTFSLLRVESGSAEQALALSRLPVRPAAASQTSDGARKAVTLEPAGWGAAETNSLRNPTAPAGGAGGAPPAGLASSADVDDSPADAPYDPRVVEGIREALSPWMPRVVAVWLAGVFCLAVWNLGGWVALHRLRRLCTAPVPPEVRDRFVELSTRLGVARPVELLRSALVAAPVVMGWLRPVVLVPASALAGLTPQQLDAILAHELAHVRRHDYLVNLFQAVAETLLFYHPAVWWVSGRMRVERELCCDDVAADLAGGRVGYADALVTMEGLRGAVPAGFQVGPALAVGACDGGLLHRVRRLLVSPGAAASWRNGGSVAAGAAAVAVPLVLLVGLLGLAGIRSAGAGDDAAAAAPAGSPADAALDAALAAPPPPPVTGLDRVPSAAERELLERVKTSYGAMRDVIRSAEYDFSVAERGAVMHGRFARDGERLYVASDAPLECAWDGRILHVRRKSNHPQLTRGTDKERFSVSISLPETWFNGFVSPALDLPLVVPPGVGQKPDTKFRFLGGKELDDPVYGRCIELEFAHTSRQGDGTLRTRHAKQYRYAPVYYVSAKTGPQGYSSEMTGVRYATFGTGDDAVHFPVRLTPVVRYTKKEWGPGFSQRTEIDEATLKVNRRIPRSRFVLRPWPNEAVYDAETGATVPAKDPTWSPDGKVGFPWAEPADPAKRRGAAAGPPPATVTPVVAQSAAPATPADAPADAAPEARPAGEPSADEQALFERVKKTYGQARAEIESVQYDWKEGVNGEGLKGRFSRSGERVYMASSTAHESAWDGRRAYSRSPWRGMQTRLNLRTGRDKFNPIAAVPELHATSAACRALGLKDAEPQGLPEPFPVFRFRSARELNDETHGKYIELGFDVTSEFFEAKQLVRHAERYQYAPVHWRIDGLHGRRDGDGPKPKPYLEELTRVRYATLKAGDVERHFPVDLQLVVGIPGEHTSTMRWQIDEATLKINEPIPRSRFVLKSWPNSETYDFETRQEVKAKNPDWSPVGKVEFPWLQLIENAQRKALDKQGAQ